MLAGPGFSRALLRSPVLPKRVAVGEIWSTTGMGPTERLSAFSSATLYSALVVHSSFPDFQRLVGSDAATDLYSFVPRVDALVDFFTCFRCGPSVATGWRVAVVPEWMACSRPLGLMSFACFRIGPLRRGCRYLFGSIGGRQSPGAPNLSLGESPGREGASCLELLLQDVR